MSSPGFLRKSATMLSGSLVAQFIPFLAAPLLTRLYTPEEFGLFGLYAALFVPAGIIATGRYDLAVVVATRDKTARSVSQVGTCLVVFSSGLAVLGVLAVPNQFVALLGNPSLRPWLATIPLTILAVGLFYMRSAERNREGHFKKLAHALVGKQGFTVLPQIGLGIGGVGGGGLILGMITGWLGGWAILGQNRRLSNGAWSPLRIRAAAKRFSAFPRYNLPLSLFWGVSKGGLVIVLSFAGLVQAAGFADLARRLLTAPVGLVTGSLGQVFFHEASRASDPHHLGYMVRDVSLFLLFLTVPTAAIFAFWAPEIFAVLFGAEWSEAGRYASALSPMIIAGLVSGWPERLFEVRGRQGIKLLLQITIDGISLILLFYLVHVLASLVSAVLYYSLAYTLLSLGYFAVLCLVGGFGARIPIQVSIVAVALGTVSWVLIVAAPAFASSAVSTIVSQGVTVAILSSPALHFFRCMQHSTRGMRHEK